MSTGKVTNFLEDHGVVGFRWMHNGRQLTYRGGSVQVVPLSSGTGFLVVEPSNETAPDNAVIINGDGSERVRIKNPVEGAMGFANPAFIRDRLTLTAFGEFGPEDCIIDEQGNVIERSQTR